MKLGISYPVFDGEELLPHVLRNIKDHVDFISIVYQTISYHGERRDDLLPFLEKLPIDKLIHFKSDPNLPPMFNEVRIRNLGVAASKDAGCTHHISADVDEFYIPEQFQFAKAQMKGHDSSIVPYINYFKYPTHQISNPNQKQYISFIQNIDNSYDTESKFIGDNRIDLTRRSKKYENCRIFSKGEFQMHHMSFVRKDIQRKIVNSSGSRYDQENFMTIYNNYMLGDRLRLLPDYINRRTVLVEDIFNIGDL